MKVYLDIDGVLCDWAAGAHQRMQRPLDYRHWPYRRGPAGWYWHNEIDWSFDQVSQLCDYAFWENLPWTEDGRAILEAILGLVDRDDVILLTTPMPHLESTSGKIAWVKKHLPTFTRRMLICPGMKYKTGLPLVPNSVLIDDRQRNIHDWKLAGGRAILVPRPWNDFYPVFFKHPELIPLHVKCALQKLI